MPRTTSSDITSVLVGQSLREARQRAGLTQAEVARRLDASAPYISGLESGRSNMTIGQLAALADALHAELLIELRVVDQAPEPEIPVPA